MKKIQHASSYVHIMKCQWGQVVPSYTRTSDVMYIAVNHDPWGEVPQKQAPTYPTLVRSSTPPHRLKFGTLNYPRHTLLLVHQRSVRGFPFAPVLSRFLSASLEPFDNRGARAAVSKRRHAPHSSNREKKHGCRRHQTTHICNPPNSHDDFAWFA